MKSIDKNIMHLAIAKFGQKQVATGLLRKFWSDNGRTLPVNVLSVVQTGIRGVSDLSQYSDSATSENESAIIAPMVQMTAEEMVQRYCRKLRALDINALKTDGNIVVAGSAGMGKSHNVFRLLNQMEADGKIVSYRRVSGHCTPQALYIALFRASSEGQVIVLDDVDVFNDQGMLDLLKAAMETDKFRRKLSWLSSKPIIIEGETEVPSEFHFHGRVIFISNINFIAEIAKGGKKAESLNAVMSRCSAYIDLFMDESMKFESIRHLLDTGVILKGIHSSIKELVWSFFVENHKDMTNDASIRLIMNIASVANAVIDFERDDNGEFTDVMTEQSLADFRDAIEGQMR